MTGAFVALWAAGLGLWLMHCARRHDDAHDGVRIGAAALGFVLVFLGALTAFLPLILRAWGL